VCTNAFILALAVPAAFEGKSGSLDPVGKWLLAALSGLLVLFVAVVLVRVLGAIDYRIGPKAVIITLFGLPVRRIRLDNIRHISSRRTGFCESWPNVLLIKRDRILVIEKRRGLSKRVLITPVQRYVFKAALDRAIREFNGLPENQRNWAAVTISPTREGPQTPREEQGESAGSNSIETPISKA